MDSFRDIKYEWSSKLGMCVNIEKIRREFISAHNLVPVKICLIGPPFSGRSRIASQLRDHYKVEVLNKKDLIAKY